MKYLTLIDMETYNCQSRSKPLHGRQRNNYLYKVVMLMLVLSHYSAALWSQQLNGYSTKQAYAFKENKGQLSDQNGKTSPSILFYGADNNTSTYFMKDQISFVFSTPRSRPNENNVVMYDASRMEMHFVNANPLATIEAQNEQSYYENYYLASCPNGVTTKSFKKLIYRNLYPHIDMNITCKDGGIEYSFDIYPGGKASDIQILWQGADNIVNVAEGLVSYVSTQGKLTESNLNVYQADRKAIVSHFVRTNNKVSFNIGTYDQNQVLTIDPTLIWSTYLGGDSTTTKFPPTDYSKSVTVDASTNVYIAGVNYNSNAVIATTGAYQTSYAGSSDAFIARFSPDAVHKVWATYFGGSGADIANSIAVDRSGHLYVTGTTSSGSGIASSGAFKTYLGTGSGTTDNAFLAKFSTSGSRTWSTYFGRGGNTRAYSVAVTRGDDYAYITGETNTTDSFFATSGVYQTSSGGNGRYDAFIAKFSSGGSRSWTTYYGGKFDDRGNGIAVDSSDNPYISGYTYSGNNIATSGAFQTSNTANAISGMVARFSSSGSLTWGSYYHGTSPKIMSTSATAICSDNFGNIYFTGPTTDSSGIATSGTYKTNNYLQSISYVCKFTKGGARVWGTYNGDSGAVTPYGIATDLAGNVFVTGEIAKYKWNPNLATSGAYQTTYGGGVADAYLTEFSSAGSRTWSTYFGGTYQDIAFGVTTDAYKGVYITGYTESDNGISTAGVYQVNKVYKHDSTTVNAFVSKFYFGPCKFVPGIGGAKSACYNSGSVYHATSTTGVSSYKWHAKGGSVIGTSIDDSAYIKWTRYGTDSLWLVESSSAGCKDSALYIVNVIKVRAYAGGATKTMCAGDSVYVGPDTAISGAIYSWTSKPSGLISTQSNFYVHPTANTTYYVTVTDGTGSCSAKDSIKIKVNPKPTAHAGTSRRICLGSSTTIGTTGASTYIYHWTSKPAGFTSSLATPTVTPGAGATYFLTVTDSITGCHSTDSVGLSANKIPYVKAGDSTTICGGDSVTLGKTGVSFYTYSWSSHPSGFSATTAITKAKPSTTTIYYVTATDGTTGCTATDSIRVRVHGKPHAKFKLKDTIFCLNDTLRTTDSSSGATSYSWSFGDSSSASTSSSPKHKFSKGGKYTIKLKITNAFGCIDTFSRRIFVDSSCVWDGDAGGDSLCVMNDLLNIGVAYDAKGYTRPFASNAWKEEPCLDWSTSFKSGVNYKHADCNGDGVVDDKDIQSIVTNYGKTHDNKKLSYSGASMGNISDPALYFSFSKDSLKVKDSLTVNINLGTSSKSVKKLYGIAFTVQYNPALIDSSAGITVDFSKSWLGTPGKDLIYVVHNDMKNGILDIAISRNDHKSISNYGSIAVLGIIMVDNVAGKVYLAKHLDFKITNITAISDQESVIKVYNQSDSVVVYQGNASINSATIKANDIKIYPNPANSVLHIVTTDAIMKEITVIDILGQRLPFSKNANAGKADINIETLKPGVYFLDIMTDKGTIRTRFIRN